jgi:hypothetical protein
VPVWHAALEPYEKAGKVAVVAIVEDQHPDRARLFLQWKQIGWPMLADSFDLLNLDTVPLTVAVDEYGIVRFTELPMAAAKTIGETFINQTYAKPSSTPPIDRGRLEMLHTGTDAIQLYAEDVRQHPSDGAAHFRLGSAFRARYDSPSRVPDDFANAERHWARALDLDPNRYIWRRRVQQYGPRMAEPYAFFDWIRDARQVIAERGETPIPLAVEPGDSEFEKPDPGAATNAPSREPDPRGRIRRDRGEFIAVDTAAVPAAPAAGETVRVHVTFRPNVSTKAHWNNSVDPLVYWMTPPAGVGVAARALVAPNAGTEVSQETRTVEYDVKLPTSAPHGRVTIPGYALYYVCEDVNGVCMYRRHDITVTIPVTP